MPASFEPIASVTLSANTSSVTFTNISQAYIDLVLVCGNVGIAAYDFIMRMQLNGDTNNNYSFTELYGTGTSAVSTREINRPNIALAYNIELANDNNGTITANFMNYSNNTTNKSVIVRTNRAARGTSATLGLYRSSSPITSIKIQCDGTVNLTSGSTFTLYGIGAGA
jgi:hypothetical protein